MSVNEWVGAGLGQRGQTDRWMGQNWGKATPHHRGNVTLVPELTESHEARWPKPYLRRLVGLDVLVAAVAGAAATSFGPMTEMRLVYALASVALPLLWPVLLLLAQGYQRRYVGVTVEEYRAVGRAVIVLIGVVAIPAVALNLSFSRGYLMVMFVSLYVGSMAARGVLRRWLNRQRMAGRLMQRTVVVGRVDAAAELVHSLKEHPEQGLLPVAVCTSPMDIGRRSVSMVAGTPVMGSADEAVEAVDLCDADVVVVTSHPELAGKALRRLAWSFEDRGVELLVSTGLLDVAGPRLSIRPAEDTSLLHVERPAASQVNVLAKDVMDRTLASLLLVLLSPVFLAIAIAIKTSSPGPVFFRQTRIGARGNPFRIFKFRTMVVDADKQLEALRHMSDGNAVQFKMKRDPRVTPIGAFLRRYSLDELPQLLNVLMGTMSLVGPRPQSQQEVDQYEPDTMRRLHVRPGMTGLWQVSGRSDLDWEKSSRLDLRYVDNWSPIFDLQILLRTVRAVVKGAGAY